MNIYLLDTNQKLCAEALADHSLKLGIESAIKILADAHVTLDKRFIEGAPLLRPDEQGVPWLYWVVQDCSHYQWLYSLLMLFSREFLLRTNIVLNPSRFLAALKDPPQRIPTNAENVMKPFPQALPLEFKRENPVEAYRLHYIAANLKRAKWGGDRMQPHWWAQMLRDPVQSTAIKRSEIYLSRYGSM